MNGFLHATKEACPGSAGCLAMQKTSYSKTNYFHAMVSELITFLEINRVL